MLSVVIPAFNEEENIGRCLEALTRQTTRRPFEVIVVDNCCTDGTVSIARSFDIRLNLKIVQETKKGRGAARALGCSHATGDIILSTDSDAEVPPQWIDSLVDALDKHPDLAATTGVPRIIDCTPWRNMMFNFFIPRFLWLNYIFYGHAGLSGFSCAVRADVYRKAGGYDPECDAYEDLELAMRVSKFGKIQLVYSDPVTFSGRRFRQGLLRGWIEYIYTWFTKFIFGKKRVLLSDVK